MAARASAFIWVSAVCLGLSTAAWAQIDDDLPALPTSKQSKPKPKPKPKPPAVKPKPSPVKPTPVVEDELPPLMAPNGQLVVKLSAPVRGAKLFIDDREMGTMPQPALTLPNGEHVVVVKRPGFATFNKKLSVSGRSQEVMVTLEPVAAVLNISTDVSGAEVLVNGQPMGVAPVAELEVPAGAVEIKLRKAGHREGTATLNVKAGRDYPVEVRLAPTYGDDAPLSTSLTPTASPTDAALTYEPSKPVYQKPWFWAVVVVAVAAAVAGTSAAVYAAQPAPKLTGTQICGGPCTKEINL